MKEEKESLRGRGRGVSPGLGPRRRWISWRSWSTELIMLLVALRRAVKWRAPVGHWDRGPESRSRTNSSACAGLLRVLRLVLQALCR